MATINYRGLSGVRAQLTVNTTDTLTQITAAAIADEGLHANYYADFFLLRDGTVKRSANGSTSYADLGLASSDQLVAVLDDDPETFTKEQRQVRKLEIATIKRAADDPARRDTYDIGEIPNPYEDDGYNADDDENTDALVVGRPWS